MALAGRCACGLALELVAKDPETHLVCVGRRRCRNCGEVKPIAEGFYKSGYGCPDALCRRCRNARNVALARKRYAESPSYRAMRQRSCRKTYWASPEIWRFKQNERDRAKAATRRAR